MKKFLLGIAMLLTAGFTFAQDNFVISPSSYAMTFDINNPDAKVEKEFTVVMNVSEPESYRAGLIFITIPQGLELVSYSSRSDIWHKAIGCWSSGELADVVVSSAYDKAHNVLKIAFAHGTEGFGIPFETSEGLFTFKCKMNDKVITGTQDFVISDNPYPAGYEGEDTRMMCTKMDDTEYFPPVTNNPVELAVELTVGEPGYATLSWPVAVDFSGTGLKASVATGVENGFVQRAEVTSVPAETPVIIEAAAGPYKLKTIAEDPAAPATNILLGTAAAAYTATSSTFALANKTDGVGFYRCKEGVEIPKYKAYIEDAGSAAEGFLFEETTGISTIDAQEADAESYTLSGVRVNQPTQKGIYIVNGKKVVVK